MMSVEIITDDDSGSSIQQTSLRFTPAPIQKLSRSDVCFPLTTPRRRFPSVASIADVLDKSLAQDQAKAQPDGQSMGTLTISATEDPMDVVQEPVEEVQEPTEEQESKSYSRIAFDELPLEVQGKVLDFIFGDMHSVNAESTSLRGKSVSSSMRHPRRKAVSDLALVSPSWREMVQERIYRHIKIKGTRAGLSESADYFYSHSHLTKHVRHIEFWVPVWGDKASLIENTALDFQRNPARRDALYNQFLLNQTNEPLMTTNDWLSFNFKLSVYSATLSEIFTHIAAFFPAARVFTLEGGHCKKSNMIRHFPKVLFSDPNQALDKLPQIRTFAMRGAWNIMRQYTDWQNIEAALPNVEEWHCGYAKPRLEADATINQILLRLPSRLRHVNISLDGMYSKDPTTLGSSILPMATHNHGQASPTHPHHSHHHAHLCERLGAILPQLESLSFTGKICECLWTSALAAQAKRTTEPRLKALEIVVKSCCRQRVSTVDPLTGETVVEELGGMMADGAGITNLTFIRAFERFVYHTVNSLQTFNLLEYVRIRFIDLDSPCTLLNPYWLMETTGKVYGIWNEDIVERLAETRPGNTGYVELGDGIDFVSRNSKRFSSQYQHSPDLMDPDSTDENSFFDVGSASNSPVSVLGNNVYVPQHQQSHGHGIGSAPGTANGGHHFLNNGSSTTTGGAASLYPRIKPRSIKTSSYRIVAETRGS